MHGMRFQAGKRLSGCRWRSVWCAAGCRKGTRRICERACGASALNLLPAYAPGQRVTRAALLLPGDLLYAAVCRRSTLQGRHKRWHRHCLVKMLYSSHDMPLRAAACPFFLHHRAGKGRQARSHCVYALCWARLVPYGSRQPETVLRMEAQQIQLACSPHGEPHCTLPSSLPDRHPCGLPAREPPHPTVCTPHPWALSSSANTARPSSLLNALAATRGSPCG